MCYSSVCFFRCTDFIFLHYCLDVAVFCDALDYVACQCLHWNWIFLVLCAAKPPGTFKEEALQTCQRKRGQVSYLRSHYNMRTAQNLEKYRHQLMCSPKSIMTCIIMYSESHTYCLHSAPPAAPVWWRHTQQALPSSHNFSSAANQLSDLDSQTGWTGKVDLWQWGLNILKWEGPEEVARKYQCCNEFGPSGKSDIQHTFNHNGGTKSPLLWVDTHICLFFFDVVA